jgi:hypothetical protein
MVKLLQANAATSTFAVPAPSMEFGATLPGNLLYPLVRTGPVVPAHPGDDQERLEAEREVLVDALGPALRAPSGAAFLT